MCVCVFAYVDFMLYVSVYVLLEFEIRIKFMWLHFSLNISH